MAGFLAVNRSSSCWWRRFLLFFLLPEGATIRRFPLFQSWFLGHPPGPTFWRREEDDLPRLYPKAVDKFPNTRQDWMLGTCLLTAVSCSTFASRRKEQEPLDVEVVPRAGQERKDKHKDASSAVNFQTRVSKDKSVLRFLRLMSYHHCFLFLWLMNRLSGTKEKMSLATACPTGW